MAKLSVVVFLALVVSFCAAGNGASGVMDEGYPKNEVETTWKKFMEVRFTKYIRNAHEATKRELNLPQEPSAAIDEKQDERVGLEDAIKTNASRASQSCTSTTGCTATASETNTSSSSSTGTSSTSTGTSSSSSSSNTSSSSSSSSGGSSSSSSSSSSSG